MIDMLLHVWVVCVLQNDCKLHNAKVWHCHHPEISPDFQIRKSWVSAYELMWFHLWNCLEDIEMTESVSNCVQRRPRHKTEKNKKIHSGPLQLVRKMIDMLLHVWVVCVLQMTVNNTMQKCDIVTIQRFLLISRSENHGWVPMIWCDFIFGFEWKTWKMTESVTNCVQRRPRHKTEKIKRSIVDPCNWSEKW